MMSFLWKRFGRSVLVVEVAALAGGYWVWSELRTNPEARRKMQARAPFVMTAFNKVHGDLDQPNSTTLSGTATKPGNSKDP